MRGNVLVEWNRAPIEKYWSHWKILYGCTMSLINHCTHIANKMSVKIILISFPPSAILARHATVSTATVDISRRPIDTRPPPSCHIFVNILGCMILPQYPFSNVEVTKWSLKCGKSIEALTITLAIAACWGAIRRYVEGEAWIWVG